MSSGFFDNFKIKHNVQFEKICKMKQHELKNHLKQRLNMQSGDGWLFKEGTFPVLLTAHMDTVHKEQCKEINYFKTQDKTVINSPVGIGGDDRCGIYMILRILEKVNCSVLFCEDEEIGSVGAKKFVKTDLCESLKGKFKYIIELDRMNDKDAVFYEDANEDFHKFVTEEFWKESWGSWSDICTLSPALEISSVNLSCGYYNQHTTKEYVVLEEMERSITETIKLLNRTDVNADPFKFEEQTYGLHNYSLYDYSWYDDYSYSHQVSAKSSLIEDDDEPMYLEVTTLDNKYYVTAGTSIEECWMNLFMENPELCYGELIDYYFY